MYFIKCTVVVPFDINSELSCTPLSLLSSTYVPSEFAEDPCDYVCRIGMPELDTNDIPKAPLDIVDGHLASPVFEVQELNTKHTLFPKDIENCLKFSAIFTSDDEATETKAMTLLNNVYEDICEFRRAIQSRKFYNQPQASTNHLELLMKNII